MNWRVLQPVCDTAVVILLCIGIGYASDHVAWFLLIGGCVGALLTILIDQRYERGLVLLAFCLPFERLGSIDISGITIRPSQLVGLILCIVAAEYLLRKKIQPRALPHMPFLILFCILSLWSLLNSISLGRSLLVTFFIFFTCSLSIVIPLLARKSDDLKRMATAFFYSYGIVVAFGLYQWAGDWIGLPPALTGLRELYTKEILGFPRLQSTALEPLYFANYLLIPLSVLCAFFLSRTKQYSLRILVPSIMLGALALVLTVARGGYIAFAVSVFVLLILNIRNLFQPRVLAVAGSSLVIGTIALFTLNGGAIFEQFLSHVTNLFVGASFNERVQMYELAQNAFAEHPFLGISAGGFGPFVSEHPLVVPPHGWNIVNNEYLELLAEHGFLGFMAMLMVWIIVSIRSLVALSVATDPWMKTMLIGCFAAFVGILVQYNTFSILYIMHIWCLIGYMVALQEHIFAHTKQR